MTLNHNSPQNIADFFIKNGFKIAFCLFVVFEFLHLLFPFLITLVFGGVVAIAVHPFVDLLASKLKTSRPLAICIFMIGFAFTILVPTALFAVKGSHLVVENFKAFLGPDFNLENPATEGPSPLDKITVPIESMVHKVTDFFDLDPKMVRSKINSFFGSATAFTLGLFNKLLAQIPDIVLNSFLFILSAWYFLLNSAKIKKLFRKYSYMQKENAQDFLDSISYNARGIFVSNIVTGSIQALIVASGAYFCGYREFFLVWFVTFIVSFIPLIGAAPVGVVLAILSFVNGEAGAGIALLVVAGITGVADNIIRPLLMSSGKTEVNGFVALLAVIGGIVIYGIPGLFLGPLIATMCFDSLPYIYKDFVGNQEIEE